MRERALEAEARVAAWGSRITELEQARAECAQRLHHAQVLCVCITRLVNWVNQHTY